MRRPAQKESEEDPNTVLVLHRFATIDEAHAFFDNADLKQAMQDAGVDMSTPPGVLRGRLSPGSLRT